MYFIISKAPSVAILRRTGQAQATGPGMFQEFYESFYQHPLLLWVAPVIFLFVLRRRHTGAHDFFLRYLYVFTVLTILDALATGPLIAWFDAPAGIRSAVGIFFVILGDLRFFALVENYRSADGPSWGSWRRALGLSLIVPVLQGILTQVFASTFEEVRLTFLVYELLFFCLAIYFFVYRIPRSPTQGEVARWQLDLTRFALCYYGLWACADVLILAGFDLGYGLRIVPNVLYYGMFLPFAFWRAPPALKGNKFSEPSLTPLSEMHS